MPFFKNCCNKSARIWTITEAGFASESARGSAYFEEFSP